MARPDHTPALLRQALEDEIDIRDIEPLGPGAWRIRGRVRSDETDRIEVLEFLESVAEDACGHPVLIEGPIIDPDLKFVVWNRILEAADRPEDVLRIQRGGPETLIVVARHQPLTLGKKRNRLPKLRKALPRWTLDVRPLGRLEEVDAIRTIPDAKAWLASFFAGTPGLDPARIHQARPDPRRQRLAVLVDAPDVGPVALARVARAVEQRTDVTLSLSHRISSARARDTLRAGLDAVDWIEKAQVKWVDRLKGVHATVEADPERREDIDALADRWTKRLGVPVHVDFDTGRSLMIGRLCSEFPEHGILTNIKHLDGTLYEVQALLPLEDPSVLDRWSDAMEERWGVQIVIEAPYLHAPDLRFRDELGADLETIARRYNRPPVFPDEVTAQAQTTADAFDREPDPGRRDIRDTIVLSIDPARTRDLDDALSIDPLGPGRYRVGVHIADVSPFVPKDSALDAEALRRGFTTYLTEGEIPVLPEVLATGVCSLHGGQDSPALSLFVDIDDDAKVLGYSVARTLIHNHCRLNYKQAQAVLDGGEHEHAWRLNTMHRLAQTLRAGRKAAGSLDLNLEPDPDKASHQLIEEFMLLANECVARFLKAEHPLGLCLYRTHPEVSSPDWPALDQVARFLGGAVRVRDQSSMQKALEDFLGFREFEIFRFHVGRALEKATYHFEQLGHGALAKQHYAHFTSPIRRYSDLIVHRLIEDALYKEERGGSSSYFTEELLPICEHLNHMEIRVNAGSFESHRLEDLRRFDGSGRSGPGVILGLMRGRMSIRLEGTDLRVSVPYRSASSKEELMPVRITDRHTGMTYSLGQEVVVQTRGVDWGRKSIDAVVVG